MNRAVCLATLGLCLGCTAHARADILYAIDLGVLTRIDTDTLTATPIGDTGISQMSGLEFGPDGKLYGVDPDAEVLVEIDITTGAATVIGPFNITVSRGSGMGWDHTTSQMYSVAKFTASSNNILVKVDLGSGGAMYVAELTDIGSMPLDGMDFDATGQLYGMNGNSDYSQLWSINKFNGSAQAVADQSLPQNSSFTIAPSGIAWTIQTPGTLYSIDLETGIATNHGLITGFTDGEGRIGALASIHTPCVADVSMDGLLTPADFSAWIAAFNAMAPACDQNADGLCTPADFTAWIANYNAGC